MNSIPSALERLSSLPANHPQAFPNDRVDWFKTTEERNSLASAGPVDLTTMPQTIDYSKLAIDNQDLCETVGGLAKETLSTLPPESFIVLGGLSGTPLGAAIGVAAANLSQAMHNNPALAEVTEKLWSSGCETLFGPDEEPQNNAVGLPASELNARPESLDHDSIPSQPNPDIPMSMDGNASSPDEGTAADGMNPGSASFDAFGPSSELDDQPHLGITSVYDGDAASDPDYEPGGMCDGSDDGWSMQSDTGSDGLPDIDHSDHPSCDIDDSSIGGSDDNFSPDISGFDDGYFGGGGFGSGAGASGSFDSQADGPSRDNREQNSYGDGDDDDHGGGGG